MTSLIQSPQNIICVTNRHLCPVPLTLQLEHLCENGIREIILREKDMAEEEYISLAKQASLICSQHKTKLILHTFTDAAKKLGHMHIHLNINDFRNLYRMGYISMYETVGVSTHTLEEAVEAEKCGAAYITASHIFPTDCKKGLEPRGLEYLCSVCKNTSIPVYALGGINFDNMEKALEAGASKACMMSELMKIEF